MEKPDLDTIEEALSITDDSTVDRINAAHEILAQWYQTNLLSDIIEILKRTSNATVKQKLLYLFKHEIIHTLINYDSNDVQNFKSIFLEIYFNVQDTIKVKELLSECISIINIIDIENIENNSEIFIFTESEEYESIKLKLQLMHDFFYEKETWSYITEYHKKIVNHFLLYNAQKIVDSLNIALQYEDYVPLTLKIYKLILLNIPIYGVVDLTLIQFLCTNYISDERTITEAAGCLTSVLIKRKDTVNIFRYYSSLIVDSLLNSKNPTSISQSITTSTSVMEFILPFLRQFLNYIVSLFFNTDKVSDPDVASSIEADTNEILQGMQDFGINPDDFGSQALELYKISLSIQPEQADFEFWRLWNEIFMKIMNERLDKSKPHPFTTFFSDILPFARESMINLFPYSFESEASVSFDARSCITMIMQIDVEHSMSYLSQLEPCPGLFYTIGCLETSIGDNGQLYEMFGNTINLIDSVNENTDEDYITSLLFAVSHCVLFLSAHENRQNLGKVLNFIVSSLQNSEKTAEAAARALHYITVTMINPLLENDMELASQIIEQSESFITTLDQSTMSLLFNSCLNIIAECSSEDIVISSINQLLSPLVDTLTNFVESPQDFAESCITALNTVNNIASGSKPEIRNTISNIFLPIYFNIMNMVLGVEDFSEISSALFASYATLITFLQYSDVQDLINTIIESFVGKTESYTILYSFVTQIRAQFKELDQKLEFILDNFVSPVLETSTDFIEEIICMITSFDICLIDIEFIKSLFKAGIEDLTPGVVVASLHLWQKLLEQNSQSFDIYKSTFQEVFTQIVTILTDELHKQSMNEIISFFRYPLVYFQVNKKIMPNQEFDDNLISILESVIGKADDDTLYPRFVTYLRESSFSTSRFCKACEDFLIVINKLAPADPAMFKIDNVRQGGSHLVNTSTQTLRAMKAEGRNVQAIAN